MGLLNAQGLPVQLILQPDRNFADLASQLSPGMTLRGRVTEVLSDGRAVVNFRGIPVTAELRNVALTRGEVISVSVQDLGGTPVFRLLPPAAPAVSMNVQSLTAVETTLTKLGLPLDGFHAALVQLLEAYGIPPSRDAALAVKDLAMRLPSLLTPGASLPEPAPGTQVSVSVAWSAMLGQASAPPAGASATVIALPASLPNLAPYAPAALTSTPVTLIWQPISSLTIQGPLPTTLGGLTVTAGSGGGPLPATSAGLPTRAGGSGAPGPTATAGGGGAPVTAAQTSGYVMGRIMASAAWQAAQPAPTTPASGPMAPALLQTAQVLLPAARAGSGGAPVPATAAGSGGSPLPTTLGGLTAKAGSGGAPVTNTAAGGGGAPGTSAGSSGAPGMLSLIAEAAARLAAQAPAESAPAVQSVIRDLAVLATAARNELAAARTPVETLSVSAGLAERVAVVVARIAPAVPQPVPQSPVPAAGVPVSAGTPTPLPAAPAPAAPPPQVLAAAELGGLLAGVVHETAVQAAAVLPTATAGSSATAGSGGAPVSTAQAAATVVQAAPASVETPAPVVQAPVQSAGAATTPVRTAAMAIPVPAPSAGSTAQAGSGGAPVTSSPATPASPAAVVMQPTPTAPATPAVPANPATTHVDVPKTLQAVAVAARGAIPATPAARPATAPVPAPVQPAVAARVLAGDALPVVQPTAPEQVAVQPAVQPSVTTVPVPAPATTTAPTAPAPAATPAPTVPAQAAVPVQVPATTGVRAGAPTPAPGAVPTASVGLTAEAGSGGGPLPATTAGSVTGAGSGGAPVTTPVPFEQFASALATRLESTPLPIQLATLQPAALPQAKAPAPQVTAAPAERVQILPASTVQTAPAVQPAPVSSPVVPAAITVDMIETASFMYARGLPATTESAGASYEYLYSPPRLPQVIEQFQSAATTVLRDASVPGVRPVPQGLRVAVERLVALARRVQVSPEDRGVHEQLKTAVEHMGLDHEARLAQAADADDGKASPVRTPAAAIRGAADRGLRSEMAQAVRDTLKSAALEVQHQARDAEAAMPAGAPRAHLSALREAASEIVQVVSAQQIGGWGGRDPVNIIQVQIPIAIGGEIKGGDIRVSWRRDKDGKKRDPRVPARMLMEVETRSLGPVGVHMQLLGQALSLIFRVYEEGVREFINGEMPELVTRLTGYKFKLEACTCELDEPEPEPAPEAPAPVRAVPPTSSVDFRA